MCNPGTRIRCGAVTRVVLIAAVLASGCGRGAKPESDPVATAPVKTTPSSVGVAPTRERQQAPRSRRCSPATRRARHRFTAPPVVLSARYGVRVYASIRPLLSVTTIGSVCGLKLSLNGFGEPTPTVSVDGFRGCYTAEPGGYVERKHRQAVVALSPVGESAAARVSARVTVRSVRGRDLDYEGATPRRFAARAGCVPARE